MTTTDQPCWKCQAPLPSGAVFCDACKAVQPSADTDYFARLSLPQAFDTGEKILDVAYFRQQRLLHPDVFVKKDEKEKRYAMAHTLDLNAAYEALKSPLKRAQYLLKLAGITVNEDNRDSVKPSQALLMDSLDKRETLEQITDAVALRTMAVAVTDERLECIDTIRDLLAAKKLDEAAQQVIRLRYLEKLVEEVKARHQQLTTNN